jgi:hypothetical protein
VRKERSDELSNEETATDRWENEGGRTQLAQQEEVNLTLSRLPRQLRLEVNNRSADVSEASKLPDTAYRWLDSGPLSWLDFSLATVLGTRSCQKSLVR